MDQNTQGRKALQISSGVFSERPEPLDIDRQKALTDVEEGGSRGISENPRSVIHQKPFLCHQIKLAKKIPCSTHRFWILPLSGCRTIVMEQHSNRCREIDEHIPAHSERQGDRGRNLA